MTDSELREVLLHLTEMLEITMSRNSVLYPDYLSFTSAETEYFNKNLNYIKRILNSNKLN